MKKLILYLILILGIPAHVLADATKTVGASGADYTTLKAAFDAINAGTITGVIVLQIIDNTTETASAVLNASGTGSANFTSVTIYPTVTGKTISGSLATPLISLNGADNVMIDGRLNATGSTIDLTITNTSTSSTAGTSTIRFINDAKTNTVKYCTLKGSSTATTGGIIFFSTAVSGTTGNDDNIISNNNITSDAAGRPVNAVFSSGTSAKANSEITISNNNIYDFLNYGTSSYGINLGSQSTAFTISGNSFYETTSFVPTASVAYYAIRVNNGSGTGFIITDNHIGGSTSSSGGTAWTKTNAFDNIFYGIYVNLGDAVVSSIQNNTIRNFSWSNSGSAAFYAVYIATGAVNVGTSTGNTIGAATGTGSITVTAGATGCYVYGVYIASTGTVSCQNNTIGSITAANSSTNASSIIGIIKTSASGTTTINSNTIGSTSTSSSINASSASSGNTQEVIGIYNSGLGDVTISTNTIANLNNATSNTAGSVAAVYFNGSTGTNVVSRNLIHSLSASGGSTTAAIYGFQIIAGVTTYYNNIIFLGGNSSSVLYGIYETGSVDETYLYFNTIYIAGEPTSGSQNSYGLYNNEDSNVRDFRNNIFFNARSNNGASGTHYAIALAGNTLTIDYNDYYVTGTGGVLGELGGNQTSLANWQTATGQDANSLNTDPTFTSAGSTTASSYMIGVDLDGVDGTGITNDYGLNSRGSSPSMGAWERGQNKWKGATSTNFNTASNWTSGVVPDIDANIVFDDAPSNHCNLDQDRSVTDITINQSTYRLVTNGYKLTIKGSLYFTGGGQINASATNSTVDFAGTSAQSVATGEFLNNKAYNLTVNNSSALTLNADFTIDNVLTINNGKVFTIAAGKYLTVTGTTTNNGTLNLRSNASGTASLIASGGAGGSGTTNAERYMTGGSGDVWHNLSSSVSGYSISSFISNPSNNVPSKGSSPITYGMEYYDEPNGVWTYYTSSNIGSAGNFIPGKGYLTRNASSGVVTFTGALNSGSISPAITVDRFGWNSVGNPYSSSIGFNNGTTTTHFLVWNMTYETLDPSYTAAYFWNATSYTIINNASAATYIQPGQGFLVKANVSASNVLFTSAMQAHANPTFYKKSTSAGFEELILNVSNSTRSAETRILFREDMSRGLDVSYDAGMFGGDTSFTIYTRLVDDNGVNFALQCLPDHETEEMVIPVGLNVDDGGKVRFDTRITTLPNGYKAILEDRNLNIFTDLSQPGTFYEVVLEKKTLGKGRFFLHVVEGPVNIQLYNPKDIKIYAVQKELYIKGTISAGAILELYDLLGKKLSMHNLNPGELNIVNGNHLLNGIYIVKIINEGILKTDRVFIND